MAARPSSSSSALPPPPKKPATAAVAVTAEDILLYVPNLIGYARILLVASSFLLLAVGPRDTWVLAVILYVGGFVGDLFDGWAARRLNQTSRFGGVLDMVTDRCSTLGWLYLLGIEYAGEGEALYRLTFLALQVLDVSSHWCQTCATLSLGLHHKSEEGNADKHLLVRWFYKYYFFFGYLCCGAEFTYVLLLVRHRLSRVEEMVPLPLPLLGIIPTSALRSLVGVSLLVTTPGCVAKQVVNVLQLCSACYAIARGDAEAINKGEKTG